MVKRLLLEEKLSAKLTDVVCGIWMIKTVFTANPFVVKT